MTKKPSFEQWMSTATAEEIDAFKASLSPEEHAILRRPALLMLSKHDTPAGFGAFFELMHKTKLHSAGVEWIAKAYQAQEDKKGLMQECHRESGKTTVFSKFFFLFRLGHNPHTTNAIIRINDDKASETSASVANIIDNDPVWKELFPDVVPDKERGWGALGYYLKSEEGYQGDEDKPDGPTFVGRGWKSGSIIGSRYNGVVIIDDIHNEENTSHAKQRNTVIKWFTDTLSYCVMDGAWEIWNYTPWRVDDVYAYAKSTGQYLINKTPVMKEAEEGDAGAVYFERVDGVPISGKWYHLYWQEQWGFDRIARKYAISGAIAFARMMLLDLEAAKGHTLRKEWLRFMPHDQILPSWPVYIGIDYATTDGDLRGKDPDFFTACVGRIRPTGGIVVVDGLRVRCSRVEALSHIKNLYFQYHPVMISPEAIGGGKSFAEQDLVMMWRELGVAVTMNPIVSHRGVSKGKRFESWLAPRCANGDIWFSNEPSPFINSLIDEWVSYPNAPHDDTIDALYMMAYAAAGSFSASAQGNRDYAPSVNKYSKNRNPYIYDINS